MFSKIRVFSRAWQRIAGQTTREAFVLISVKKDIPLVMSNIYAKYIRKNKALMAEERVLVFGGTDIIIKLKSDSVQAIHDFVINVIQDTQVISTRTLMVNSSDGFREGIKMVNRNMIEAYVLVAVVKNIPEVMDQIKANPKNMEYITEMALVYGGFDIMIKIQIPAVEKLHDLVIEQIQGLELVASTQTFIIDPKAKFSFDNEIDSGKNVVA
jgi:DNA-binding Lrp family transcriptional regulator